MPSDTAETAATALAHRKPIGLWDACAPGREAHAQFNPSGSAKPGRRLPFDQRRYVVDDSRVLRRDRDDPGARRVGTSAPILMLKLLVSECKEVRVEPLCASRSKLATRATQPAWHVHRLAARSR